LLISDDWDVPLDDKNTLDINDFSFSAFFLASAILYLSLSSSSWRLLCSIRLSSLF
jgi:hypothetical protein